LRSAAVAASIVVLGIVPGKGTSTSEDIKYIMAEAMNIPLEELAYQFHDKPLLIGGMAMEYYGLRKAGADIDLVVSSVDHARLRHQYPHHIKDLYGDIGVCEFGFEIWNQICRYDYEELKIGAIEEVSLLIISLERLLFLKTLAIKQEKYYQDVLLLVDEILKRKYS
jgi:hypothetical protein